MYPIDPGNEHDRFDRFILYTNDFGKKSNYKYKCSYPGEERYTKMYSYYV